MFEEPFNFVRKMEEFVDKRIEKKTPKIELWQVTSIPEKNEDGYITDYKLNIRHLNFKKQLDNVPVIGLGLGHGKGILVYPSVGDIVVVTYLDNQPYIIGTIYDTFSQNPDIPPMIKENEMLIAPKRKGSVLLFKENNDVIIRASDSEGNFNNGAKIRINNDGSFKLLDKLGHGIVSDGNGKITLSGVEINATKNPIQWN